MIVRREGWAICGVHRADLETLAMLIGKHADGTIDTRLATT